MRIREPKTTALIFASGKMVVTGAKSEDDSKLASRKYARIIQKLGFNAKFTDFKIQNIVGSCDIKFPIRLEGLASRHHNFSSYEPELFPGLIYRMIRPKIVLLIFVSGKIVLTGAKVREEIYSAFELIYPVLSGMCGTVFRLMKFGLIVIRLQESLSLRTGNLSTWGDHTPDCINTSNELACTVNPTTPDVRHELFLPLKSPTLESTHKNTLSPYEGTLSGSSTVGFSTPNSVHNAYTSEFIIFFSRSFSFLPTQHGGVLIPFFFFNTTDLE